MSNVVEVYQPPQKGYFCKECGVRITRLGKTGMCRGCAVRKMMKERWKRKKRGVEK